MAEPLPAQASVLLVLALLLWPVATAGAVLTRPRVPRHLRGVAHEVVVPTPLGPGPLGSHAAGFRFAAFGKEFAVAGQPNQELVAPSFVHTVIRNGMAAAARWDPRWAQCFFHGSVEPGIHGGLSCAPQWRPPRAPAGPPRAPCACPAATQRATHVLVPSCAFAMCSLVTRSGRPVRLGCVLDVWRPESSSVRARRAAGRRASEAPQSRPTQVAERIVH